MSHSHNHSMVPDLMSASWDYETHGTTSSVSSFTSIPSFDEERVHVIVSGVSFHIPPTTFSSALAKLPWQEKSGGHLELHAPPTLFQMLLDYATFQRLPCLVQADAHSKKELATLAAVLGFDELHDYTMDITRKRLIPRRAERQGSWRRLFPKQPWSSSRQLQHQQLVEKADFVL